MEEKIKTKCYLCGKVKKCIKTLIYEKKDYKYVYLCEKCLLKRYGKEVN